MRGKWIVASIAIILGILSIRQLSYTWYTNKVESEARLIAADETQEQFVIDSLANDTLNLGIMKFNYHDAKQKEMKLGLDLKGGISVILQVQVRDLLENLSDRTQNPIFNEALDAADIKQRTQGNRAYVDIFFEEFERLRSEKGVENLNYSSPDIFGNRQNANLISFNATDDEVKDILRHDVDSKIGTAFQVISSRINRFGVVEPVIQRLGGAADGRILVEMPGERNKERIKNLLQSTAKLEFWKVEDNSQIFSFFTNLNPQSLGIETETTSLQDIIQPPMEGRSLFTVMNKDTALLNRVLQAPGFKAALPTNIRNFKYDWANKPVESKDPNINGKYLSFYALSGNAKGEPLLPGDVVDKASGERNTASISNEPVVSMTMNAEGAQKWAQITEENVGQSIAIVLDDLVYSAPNINEKIGGGRSQISGNFTLQEAQDLANILQAGSLPASSKIVQLEEVGPSLGQETIDSSLTSFFAVFLLILAWMMFYYSRAGVYADIALALNILILLGLLVGLLGATLSLPGIAGIILTLGMAIDANIIINERVKEEMLHRKRTVKEAVSIAYSWKGAISAIFDANVTTILSAAVLLYFGKGPVQGFAITLILGLSVSLFTSIFVTKLFVDDRLEKGKSMSFYTKLTKNWLQGIHINFMKRRKVFYFISGTVMILCLVSALTRGFDLGVDFQGGRTYTIRFDNPVSVNDARSSLDQTLVDDNGVSTSPTVKIFGASNQIKVTTKLKSNVESTEADAEVMQKVYEGVKPFLPENMSFKDFADDKVDIGVMSIAKVGPTIASDTTRASIIAVIVALFVIGIYIVIQYRWQYSVGLIAAAVHDVIIIFGLFAFLHGRVPFNLELDQPFIAAILTVIGYSINDTVIIFDRIREFFKLYPTRSFSKVINGAINSTLPRTVNTSVSMILVVLIIFLFGGETIKGFMFAMLVGVLVGTYSSVYISSQIMYDLSKKQVKAEKKKIMAEARA